MTKQETYDYLRAHGVDFEITEHPAVFNMEECAAVDMPYPEDDAKNLLVRDDKKRSYYLITVRCGKRVDLKEFQRRHGTRRLSFASPEELLRLLDNTDVTLDVFNAAAAGPDPRLRDAAGAAERPGPRCPLLPGPGFRRRPHRRSSQ